MSLKEKAQTELAEEQEKKALQWVKARISEVIKYRKEIVLIEEEISKIEQSIDEVEAGDYKAVEEDRAIGSNPYTSNINNTVPYLSIGSSGSIVPGAGSWVSK